MRSLASDIVITANKRNSVSLRELWLYRELFYFFAWRDIKVRYKQTALGAGWAILQPFLATGVFTIFFNKVAGISAGDLLIPYAVFAYLGLMYWSCFSSALNTISNSLVASAGVITKIYFPRLIPCLSAAALSVVDFFFASIVFFIMLAVYGISPDLEGFILFLPALLLVIVTALGVGIFFAALNVKYRDVRSALPFVTQLLLFMSPIIYPLSYVPERFQIYVYLNPVAGAVTTIRSAFFNGEINWFGNLISLVMAIIGMIIGIWYFKRTEKNFADIV